jgi:hypothetical protein
MMNILETLAVSNYCTAVAEVAVVGLFHKCKFNITKTKIDILQNKAKDSLIKFVDQKIRFHEN